MLWPCTNLSHHMLASSLARVSLAVLQGHEQHLAFSIKKKQSVERKGSAERTQLKKLTGNLSMWVLRQDAGRLQWSLSAKLNQSPSWLSSGVQSWSCQLVPAPSEAQSDVHVTCRCLYGPRTCKVSNGNRNLPCCCTNMIAVLLPLQPCKHCAAAILSEKNTLLWCNHFFFQHFANPKDPFPDNVQQTPNLENIFEESCKKYGVTKVES